MLRTLFHRLLSHLRRERTELEMDDEMRFHLELVTRENQSRGMSTEDARRAARVRLPPPPPVCPGKAVPELLWGRMVAISPRYFETMRIPVKQGREFNRFDTGQSVPVAVINETMARRYWQGKDSVGKRIRFRPFAPWVTIVAIVGDSMQNAREGKALPTLYLPLLQSSRRPSDLKESEALLR